MLADENGRVDDLKKNSRQRGRSTKDGQTGSGIQEGFLEDEPFGKQSLESKIGEGLGCNCSRERVIHNLVKCVYTSHIASVRALGSSYSDSFDDLLENSTHTASISSIFLLLAGSTAMGLSSGMRVMTNIVSFAFLFSRMSTTVIMFNL